MDYYQRIISMAAFGPLQPVKVAKELNTTSLIASAMLSELKEKGKLKVSHLKLGSSPLYYLPGNENQLEVFVNNLNEKEKKVYDLLKKEKILRDSKLDPLTKLCLKQLKDFAEPIKVTYKNQTEIFWKWYGINNLEAETKIKQLINPSIKKEDLNNSELSQQKNQALRKSVKSEVEVSSKIKNLEKEYKKYLNEHKINLVEVLSKKAREKDLIIEIPSSIGKLKYFCKIKSKKTITDSDVSKAFMQGQSQKLPVIILSTGSLNKKAKELLNEIKGVIFCKV